jgi:uncharacterized protein YabN with tetrapyrrole methylase and pyrophosphatase domain
MEQAAASTGKTLTEMTLLEMEALWERIKRRQTGARG